MMNEHVVQLGPMWVLAGLSAGWLAETSVIRRGYGLIVDMGLGVGAGLVGGGVLLAVSGLPAGMFAMFAVAFVVAAGVILAQRLWWPCVPDAQERKARRRLVELAGHSLEGRTVGPARPMPSGVLVRVATTGIYLLRGVPLELQRAARGRAARDGTTLRQVLLKGLGEYAAGTWTPQPDEGAPGALNPGIHATRR
ncbi:MAG TPA: hypothetical protein VIF59_02895 [Methylomirabilota bacterium]|jgi:hypothetical protein